MSDIQEEQKRLYKRAEENDYDKLLDKVYRAIHLIRLLQMEGKVEIKDLGNIANILQGDNK